MIGPNTADLDRVTDLAIEGAAIDGGHHKQWYLVQILDALGVTAEERADHGIWDEGITP